MKPQEYRASAKEAIKQLGTRLSDREIYILAVLMAAKVNGTNQRFNNTETTKEIEEILKGNEQYEQKN